MLASSSQRHTNAETNGFDHRRTTASTGSTCSIARVARGVGLLRAAPTRSRRAVSLTRRLVRRAGSFAPARSPRRLVRAGSFAAPSRSRRLVRRAVSFAPAHSPRRLVRRAGSFAPARSRRLVRRAGSFAPRRRTRAARGAGWETHLGRKWTHEFVSFQNALDGHARGGRAARGRPTRARRSGEPRASRPRTPPARGRTNPHPIDDGARLSSRGARRCPAYKFAALAPPFVEAISLGSHAPDNCAAHPCCRADAARRHERWVFLPDAFSSDCRRVLDELGPKGGNRQCSSGFAAVHLARRTCGSVSIFGAVDDPCYPFHYVDPMPDDCRRQLKRKAPPRPRAAIRPPRRRPERGTPRRRRDSPPRPRTIHVTPARRRRVEPDLATSARFDFRAGRATCATRRRARTASTSSTSCSGSGPPRAPSRSCRDPL